MWRGEWNIAHIRTYIVPYFLDCFFSMQHISCRQLVTKSLLNFDESLQKIWNWGWLILQVSPLPMMILYQNKKHFPDII